MSRYTGVDNGDSHALTGNQEWRRYRSKPGRHAFAAPADLFEIDIAVGRSIPERCSMKSSAASLLRSFPFAPTAPAQPANDADVPDDARAFQYLCREPWTITRSSEPSGRPRTQPNRSNERCARCPADPLSRANRRDKGDRQRDDSSHASLGAARFSKQCSFSQTPCDNRGTRATFTEPESCLAARRRKQLMDNGLVELTKNFRRLKSRY